MLNELFLASPVKLFPRLLAFAVVLIALQLNCRTHAAIINTPGLTSIVFWEVSNAPAAPYTFAHNGPEMTTQLGVGVLGPNNSDFSPLTLEHYDVFYSDANGTFNVFGDHVTVEAIYPVAIAGGGLNIAAVDLLIGSSTFRADVLSSWVGMGPNYIVGSEVLAVDADTAIPTTFTTMGSTSFPPTSHLRITVTWPSLVVPEPSSYLLLLSGGVGLCLRRRRVNDA